MNYFFCLLKYAVKGTNLCQNTAQLHSGDSFLLEASTDYPSIDPTLSLLAILHPHPPRPRPSHHFLEYPPKILINPLPRASTPTAKRAAHQPTSKANPAHVQQQPLEISIPGSISAERCYLTYIRRSLEKQGHTCRGL